MPAGRHDRASMSYAVAMNRIAAAASLASVIAVASSAIAQQASVTAPPAAPAAPKSEPSTIAPVPRNDQWWQDRHAAAVERAKEGKVDMLFIGDSITQGWEGEGKDVWAKQYAPRNAMNIGFSGDRTQHVLWRLDNGEIAFGDGHQPKLAVIMIGTNNSNGNDNTADEIAQGIEAIVASLRSKLPETKILLLAIFPRGEAKPSDNPQRDKNAAASARAAKLADGKMVHVLDIGPNLTNADGTISPDVMPDYLHLSAKGYQQWADAIEGKVKELMGGAETGTHKPKSP